MLRRKLSNHAMIDYYEIKSQPITRVMVLQAYKKVRANKGSGGVDDMDWEWLDNNLKTELYKLWNRLTSGSYFPMPVKEVPIKKKGGGERKLGIPTLLVQHRSASSKNTFGTHFRTTFSQQFVWIPTR